MPKRKQTESFEKSRFCEQCQDYTDGEMYCKSCWFNPSKKMLDFEIEEISQLLQTAELFIEVGSFQEADFVIEQFRRDVPRCLQGRKCLGDLERVATGHSYTLGYVGKHPVQVQFSYVKLNNHVVAFYHPTSQLVYYPIIEEWLKKHFPVSYKPRTSYHEMTKFCLPMK